MCGALALIERTGSDEAVTLRAVAREVGIAAPSIYPHFADRDAIVMAVVVRIFAELTDAIEAGEAAAGPDPVDRLVAGCAAYVEYGLSHPARYGVLFSERRASAQDYCEPMALGPDGRPVLAWGADAFEHLVRGIGDCVTAGVSTSTEVPADATAVWVALHGMVTLRSALPGFPWPSRPRCSGTRCSRWPGLPRGDPVDGLAQQVSVTVVPRVLPDQVHVHHPQRPSLTVAIVERGIEIHLLNALIR